MGNVCRENIDQFCEKQWLTNVYVTALESFHNPAVPHIITTKIQTR